MKRMKVLLLGLLFVGCIKTPVQVEDVKLPDIVIIDVYAVTDLPYLYIRYKNAGEGETCKKFAFSVMVDTVRFITAECFTVGRPGEEKITGGLDFLMMGAKRGDTKNVQIQADFTMQIKECDEWNNGYGKQVLFKHNRR